MWRSIIIRNPAKLSLRHNQLLIQQKESYTVPLEDIAIILLESKEITITAPLLSTMAQYGVTLLSCDECFLPCGQWLPFAQHSRGLKIINAQIALKVNLKKQLWRSIIQQKINHQAQVLDYTGHDIAAKRLRYLAENIKQGDKDNKESEAAYCYFRVLFGRDFSRRHDHNINHHLNYGYSIMRAAIARALVQHGFLPTLGLFHHNEQNPFNLADDMIEPYRPLVDFYIYQQIEKNKLPKELTPKSKQSLIALLNYEMKWKVRIYNTLTAIEKSVASLQTALLERQANFLVLPQLLELKEHQYE